MYNIASERKRIDITQKQLAEKLEVSERTVARWEQGLLPPNANNIIAMGQIFSCSSDYLLGLSDERRPSIQVA